MNFSVQTGDIVQWDQFVCAAARIVEFAKVRCVSGWLSSEPHGGHKINLECVFCLRQKHITYLLGYIMIPTTQSQDGQVAVEVFKLQLPQLQHGCC